jgi:tetratricopeptide (TPR) repeat protein
VRVAALLLGLIVAAPALGADPALVKRMAHLATHYHEDPARLDAGRAELEAAVTAEPSVPLLVSLAQITYIWGDVRAKTRDDKLAAYERGRRVADLAVQREPGNADARFWRAVNLGRWAEQKGAFQALSEIKTLREEMNAILERHPDYTSAYSFLGSYYYQLPRVLGGDVDKAMSFYRKGLALNPRASGMRVGLAKTLIAKEMPKDARVELRRVLDETAPSNPAEWSLRDVPAARKLLETLDSTR